MKIIFDYNRTIFNSDTNNLYPGVLELLRKLSSKYELFLISRNEPMREKRFEELNIKNYFRKIIFIQEKSKQAFKEIAGDTKDVIVIGDRISDEIKIGNRLNFTTIRIKQGKFSLENPREKDELADFEVKDISELETIISGCEKKIKL